jgi:hypothetical protein
MLHFGHLIWYLNLFELWNIAVPKPRHIFNLLSLQHGIETPRNNTTAFVDEVLALNRKYQ